MGFRNISEKYRVKALSEKGVALFTAMMLLVLVSGFAFFILQNAATQIQIANEFKRGYGQTALVESGVEQALAWLNDPQKNPCEKKPNKPFFYKMEEIGDTIQFKFYKPVRGKKDTGPVVECTVVVSASSGKSISIDLMANPMPLILEPVYSGKQSIVHLPDFLAQMDKVRRSAKRFGRYLVVSKDGTLEERGVDIGTFDKVFAMNKESANKLVFIDCIKDYSSSNPLKIGKRGQYKGYFYFTCDIEIEGGGSGQPILITDVDLEGFFYTWGKVFLKNNFSIYGALYAGSGLEKDDITQLNVFYNTEYTSGFKGMLPLVPIVGSQKIVKPITQSISNPLPKRNNYYP